MNNLTHTIAAVSTPPGKGGVAVIRISGEGALDIVGKVFAPMSGRALTDYPARTQVYGYVVDGEEKIDDVLAAYFPAPRSYTGEDTVEICCHGGIAVTRTVLETVLSAGARYAEAGEFTRRAFINGTLSLTEAEAIGNLLEAKGREQIKLSALPARERLNNKIGEIRSALLDIMSSIYARIDYPDEDLGDFDDSEVARRLAKALNMTESLISTYRTGRAIAEGIKTVICGKPNVGKSSLYNLLSGEDAAIVTDIPGTTRDVLERTVPLGKIMLRIADTAGIRDTDSLDAVERIGIEKSRKLVAESELLFALFDLSEKFDDEDAQILEEIKHSSSTKIAILNKSDKPEKLDKEKLGEGFDAVITVSAARDGAEAIASLSDIVNRLFTDEKITVGQDAVISTARQHAALKRAMEFTELAIAGLRSGFSQDAVSTDIERALGAISELDGRAVNEEVVADIFSKFCVGK